MYAQRYRTLLLPHGTDLSSFKAFRGSHPTGTRLPNETDKHCSFCSLNHNRGRTFYCQKHADLNNLVTRSQVAGYLREAANLVASPFPGSDAIKGTRTAYPLPQR